MNLPHPSNKSTKNTKNSKKESNVLEFHEKFITNLINEIEFKTCDGGYEDYESEKYSFNNNSKVRQSFKVIEGLGIHDQEIAYYMERQIEHDLDRTGVYFELDPLERKVLNAIYTSSPFYYNDHVLSINDISKIIHRKPPFIRKAIAGIEEKLESFFFIIGESPTPNHAKCKFIILWEDMFNYFYSRRVENENI